MITCAAAITAFRCTPVCSIYCIVFYLVFPLDNDGIVDMAYLQVKEL